MLHRIILSILFIPVIAFIIYANLLEGLLFFIFIIILSLLSSRELFVIVTRIFELRNFRKSLLWFFIPDIILIASYYINLFFKVKYIGILYLLIYTFVFLLVFHVINYKLINGFINFTIFFLGYIYTGFFPLILLVIKHANKGTILLYVLFFLVWLNDASGYFIGTYFGKKRGIVKFSPNKSLEGYVGSFVVTLGASIGLKLLFPEDILFNYAQTMGLGFIIAFFAPLGDIGESVLKRSAGMKDSGRFLPGFGGVLDIFDSILISSPFYYLFLRFFGGL